MIQKINSLKRGDTIGIINPSFKNNYKDSSEYQDLINMLSSRGYKVKFFDSFYKKDGYLVGSDEERSADINKAFNDEEVKAIICMRGGYGASRIVDKVDYDIIRNNPKIFSGYSDITVFLNSIYSKAHFATFHGLVGASLNKKETNSSIEAFFDMLENKTEGKVLKSIDKEASSLVKGKAEGVLVGGNLSLLATLCGGEYDVDFSDKIVFIEDVGEDVYRIDRYFSSLRLNHSLEKAKGFILGYFTNCEKKEGCQSIEDIINDYILPLNKPTISNFTCGHEMPFVTLPIGTKVLLDVDKKEITIMEEIYNEG